MDYSRIAWRLTSAADDEHILFDKRSCVTTRRCDLKSPGNKGDEEPETLLNNNNNINNTINTLTPGKPSSSSSTTTQNAGQWSAVSLTVRQRSSPMSSSSEEERGYCGTASSAGTRLATCKRPKRECPVDNKQETTLNEPNNTHSHVHDNTLTHMHTRARDDYVAAAATTTAADDTLRCGIGKVVSVPRTHRGDDGPVELFHVPSG
ncbi:hypothetical protein AGLY_012783 [Aphis glycines]|uniref:Uncharacterized protein n=1 Tax=Aphis glycines TaxID=307491 RepID=A0A6G0T8Q3_APHGL|nr:hypothetical protein AGLY_012783 [Aphis glycines]